MYVEIDCTNRLTAAPPRHQSFHTQIIICILALTKTYTPPPSPNIYIYVYRYCYTVGKAILSEEIPRWKTVTAHIYIWAFTAMPFVFYNAPTQWFMRRENYETTLTTPPSQLLLSMMWAFVSLFLHIVVSIGMVITFTHSLNYLASHVHVRRLHPDKIAELRALSTKAAVYASFSLVLFLYLWGACLSYPYSMQLAITLPPFQFFFLLLIQCCFVVKLPRAPVEEATEEGEGEDDEGKEGEGEEGKRKEKDEGEEGVLSARAVVELGVKEKEGIIIEGRSKKKKRWWWRRR